MNRSELLKKFSDVRRTFEELCKPLETEDYVVQPISDVSPAKWHIGHTTWFFETFILQNYIPDYKPYHPLYSYVLNSYYNHAGDRWTRENRGYLSRPTVDEIYAYRTAVTEKMCGLIESVDDADWQNFHDIITPLNTQSCR